MVWCISTGFYQVFLYHKQKDKISPFNGSQWELGEIIFIVQSFGYKHKHKLHLHSNNKLQNFGKA